MCRNAVILFWDYFLRHFINVFQVFFNLKSKMFVMLNFKAGNGDINDDNINKLLGLPHQPITAVFCSKFIVIDIKWLNFQSRIILNIFVNVIAKFEILCMKEECGKRKQRFNFFIARVDLYMTLSFTHSIYLSIPFPYFHHCLFIVA